MNEKARLLNDRGQGMVEYILIVALVALIALAGVKMFGGKIKTLFVDSSNKIQSEASSGINAD